MRIFDFIQVMNPAISPERCKIHLAGFNGEEDPLDVYLTGGFEAWQRWQTRRNFERAYVLSLIQMRRPHHWLYAGVHASCPPIWHANEGENGLYHYADMTEDTRCHEFNGRLIVHFERGGRNAYRDGERWAEALALAEILPNRIALADFPGYRAINLSHDELTSIFAQGIASWRTPLQSVAGIYLITDAHGGGLYVGIACGEGGFWQRWSSYARTGHGGNIQLRHLLDTHGDDYKRNFRYAILEIADLLTLEGELRPRETHWKNILHSRAHGLNAN